MIRTPTLDFVRFVWEQFDQTYLSVMFLWQHKQQPQICIRQRYMLLSALCCCLTVEL